MAQELAERQPQTSERKPLAQVRDLLNRDDFKSQIAAALPKHLTPDRFLRVALTAINRNPALANCTQSSLCQCLLDLSSMGIEPDGRRAHLIPFKNNRENRTDCTLIVDYKGIVELAQRSGVISNIHADAVCENDVFEYDRGEIKKHVIDFRRPRGKAYAYYCLVRFRDGTEKAEVMSLDEVYKIRDSSQGYKAAIKYSKGHPWIDSEAEMAKKTVFKRCSKWITLSPEIRDVVERDDDPVTIQAPSFDALVKSAGASLTGASAPEFDNAQVSLEDVHGDDDIPMGEAPAEAIAAKAKVAPPAPKQEKAAKARVVNAPSPEEQEEIRRRELAESGQDPADTLL